MSRRNESATAEPVAEFAVGGFSVGEFAVTPESGSGKIKTPLTRADAVRRIGNTLKQLAPGDTTRVLNALLELHGE